MIECAEIDCEYEMKIQRKFDGLDDGKYPLIDKKFQ